MARRTVRSILDQKNSGRKITMLTAYDYCFARCLDQAGIDILLVGDSMANVVFGLDSTKDITVDQMLDHAKAVSRGVESGLVVGDMPFDAYQKDPHAAVKNAKRFVDAGCDAVKIEWCECALDVTKKIVESGIPVMGHVGLTPQTAEELGGFKVQGRDAQAAKQIVEQASAFEREGCFAVVLECVPDVVAQMITSRLKVPTIGIGAGPYCDGQVLVIHDLLGLFDRYHPKFVRVYEDIHAAVIKAAEHFRADVMNGSFPTKEESFVMKETEVSKLMGLNQGREQK